MLKKCISTVLHNHLLTHDNPQFKKDKLSVITLYNIKLFVTILSNFSIYYDIVCNIILNIYIYEYNILIQNKCVESNTDDHSGEGFPFVNLMTQQRGSHECLKATK